jgi:hypothetical protein
MLELVLKELGRNQALLSTVIHATDEGYVLVATTKTGTHKLSLYRGGLRYFKTIDAAASVARACGCKDVKISWEPLPDVGSPMMQRQRLPEEEQKTKTPPPPGKRLPPPKKKKKRR